MDLTIRPFTDSQADYEAVVGVHNIVFPHNSESVEDWRQWDSTRPERCYLDRWVAEEGGHAVGFAHAVQFAGMYHPRKFHVEVRVLPEARRRGIGARLYDTVVGRLSDPLTLRTKIREDMADGVAFLAARGYGEEMRGWDSRLDVQAFDPGPFAGYVARAEANGVEITTLGAHVGESEARRRELYEALVEMNHDVPRPDPFTPVPFEEWERQNLTDPHLLPDGYFIALVGGQIAGVSQLWGSSTDGVLYVGLTATRRDFRRLGIAMALKVRANCYAKAAGAREIRTGNESNNRPILAINEAMGFVKQPAWITFVKNLGEVPAAG